MTSFALKLHTLATNDPNPGSFVLQLKPEHKETLAHAIDLQGQFLTTSADGYALLDYPPCWHLAEFRLNSAWKETHKRQPKQRVILCAEGRRCGASQASRLRRRR